mmetsp:Transcript_75518/g.214781  ORF Transcript_75518/g.214781 Transcript_75518/m.214781 type:complete len:95 (-) Transcript_75518:5058-5342(-)
MPASSSMVARVIIAAALCALASGTTTSTTETALHSEPDSHGVALGFTESKNDENDDESHTRSRRRRRRLSTSEVTSSFESDWDSWTSENFERCD